MYRMFLFICLLTIVLLSQSATAHVEGTADSLLYVVVNTEDSHQIRTINVRSGEEQIVVDVPKTQLGVLAEVLPESEKTVLSDYLIQEFGSADLANLSAEVRVQDIVASPDNRQVIAKIVYSRWFNRYRIGFGTTQLVVFDRIDGTESLLFNQGFNDTQFLSEYSSVPGVFIQHFEWVQEYLFVSITDGNYRGNLPIIVSILRVSVVDGFIVKIGDGVDWTISSTDDRLIILQTQNRLPNTVVVADFNPELNVMTQSEYVLDSWFIDEFVLADSVVFLSVAFNTIMPEGGGGFAVFDLRSNTHSMEFPGLHALEIQSSADTSIILVETSDHQLLRVVQTNGEISLQQYIERPVTYWLLGNQGNLLVQYTETGDAYVVDVQGTESAIHGLTVADIDAPTQSEQIIAIDW